MAIVWNEQRYRQVFQSTTGTVGRFLRRTGPKIQTAARAIITEERLVRSGRYRSSLAWRLTNSSSTLVLEVGSAVPHARLIEYGTDAHVIAARNKRALWWDMPNDRGWMVQPDSGRPVRFVMHPGTRPYLVINRAIRRVLGGGIILP